MTTASTRLHQQGILQQRAQKGQQMLSCCVLCPRRCKVNRLAGETGVCGTDAMARIASYGPHFGEEQPLVGSKGSGTIFLASCSLRCCFCQNYDISHHSSVNEEVNARDFAAVMLELQQAGCHNINLVTPSHVVPQILAALGLAVEGGLSIPVVYNSSGYDSIQALDLLDGAIDIYMPDFKFWESETATRYAGAPDYPERAKTALQCMHRQVGDLQLDSSGIAVSGLLLRHLLMPGLMEETRQILSFIAQNLSTTTYINIMDQYRPCGNAGRFPELNRSITAEEYQQAMTVAKQLGLSRLDQRDLGSLLRRLKLL